MGWLAKLLTSVTVFVSSLFAGAHIPLTQLTPLAATSTSVQSQSGNGANALTQSNQTWIPISQTVLSNYQLKDGVVHYVSHAVPDFSGASELHSNDVAISGADINSFVIFPNTQTAANPNYQVHGAAVYYDYAKDKNHLYIEGAVFKNADPGTFSVMTDARGNISGYSQDKNHVYVNDQLLKDVAPNSLKLVEDAHGALAGGYLGWASDLKHIYNGLQLVGEADVATFQSVNDEQGNNTEYAKDKSHVYTTNLLAGTTVVGGADSSSFVAVSKGYYDAQDKNHFYLEGAVVKGPSSTAVQIYLNGEPTGYYKDSLHVYEYAPLEQNILSGVDPKTFDVLATHTFPGSDAVISIVKDKNHVYFDGDGGPFIPTGVDVASYMPLVDVSGAFTLYAKDKNHVYYENYPLTTDNRLDIVPNADTTTFHAIASADACGGLQCTYDAMDAQNKYNNGMLVVPKTSQ